MKSDHTSQWIKWAPLLYSVLANASMKPRNNITAAKFFKDQKFQNSFSFQSLPLFLASKNPAGNGVLSIHKVDVPIQKDHEDNRLKCMTTREAEYCFQNPISQVEEIVFGHTKTPENTFLAVCQARKPDVQLYSLDVLLSKEKAVKPRKTLSGKSEVTALKCRRQELLLGREDGSLDLYGLGKDTKSDFYAFHKSPITDLCWLSQNERAQEKIFATSSQEPHIYIWDKRMPRPALQLDHRQEVNCLQFVRNHYFLSAGKPNIKFWDIRNLTCQAFTYEGQKSDVTHLCRVDNDLKGERFMFASGGKSGQVLLWEEGVEFFHGAHHSPIVDLSFSKDCDLFLSVQSNSSSVNLWKPIAMPQKEK